MIEVKGVKLARTIQLLKRRYTTSLECAQQGGVLSLSQRVSRDLRPAVVTYDRLPNFVSTPRFVILEKWVETASGSRVKAWKIAKDRAQK